MKHWGWHIVHFDDHCKEYQSEWKEFGRDLKKSGVNIVNAVGDRDFCPSVNKLDVKDNCTLDDLNAWIEWTWLLWHNDECI